MNTQPSSKMPDSLSTDYTSSEFQASKNVEDVELVEYRVSSAENNSIHEENSATSNGALEYGQEHITVDFTNYTDITSEVEVGEVGIGEAHDTDTILARETTVAEMDVPAHDIANEEPAVRARASSEDTLYCFCRQPWDSNNVRFMIECTHCKGWFHGSCVGVPESIGSTIESYHCKVCEPIAGPVIYKNPNEKPIKAGTKEFLRKLKEKQYLSADKIVLRLKGEDLTLNRFLKKGFAKPILVEETSGLEMKVPRSNFTVREVEAYVGSDTEVDVIDVERQTDLKMTMKEFCDYFTYPARNKLYNLISLEFSKTRLNALVNAPAIVRKLDWINSWKVYGTTLEPPSVGKYCLISTKESFTDFHIDFGGTSVWYHVLWGEKVFYLIEPTPTNLLLYQRWMSSNPQDYETFFADIVDYCYQIILKPGQTLLIPTGWIHAVLTTQDSLVFGGNFLHHLNIDIQLKVYEIEKALEVPNKYLFPYFESCTWYAAQDVLSTFEQLNRSNCYPVHFIDGLRALGKAFRSWTGEDTVAREVVPKIVRPRSLIKQITRVVRMCDRRIKQADMTGYSSRKGSVSGSLQSTSNPTSPDIASGSSSESEVILNHSSRKRKLRISDSSASPNYANERELYSTTTMESRKPIKIKIRKVSLSDNSNHTSPDRQLPLPTHDSTLDYAQQTVPDTDTWSTQNHDEEFNKEGLQNENECNEPMPIGWNNKNSEVSEANHTSSSVRILEPDYFDANGMCHYLTNNVLVETIDDESQNTAENTIEEDLSELNSQTSSMQFITVEPESIDENGCKHYMSAKKLAIVENRINATFPTQTPLWKHNDVVVTDYSEDKIASEEANFAVSANSSTGSNPTTPSRNDDDLVIAYSSDSSSSTDEEQSKHRRRRHRHHKHRHHSKKAKKSKSRDSSGSRHKKHKKHRKHKHSKHVEPSSLDSALAGTLNGMESLFKDARYNERLAETANRSSTSASMKEAFAEIIENESTPLETRLKRSKARKAADPWAEENIQKVHQDDDFIYLPLTGESTDDEASPKKRKLSIKEKRKEKSEAWSPSVKLGQITKREACPTRTKAKVLAVEKGLENAAAALAKEEKKKKSPVLQSVKKKPNNLKIKVVKPRATTNSESNEWRLVSGEGNAKNNPGPSTSTQKTATATANKPNKLKKGHMTPKQRLMGKILKLGKLK